LGKKNTPFWKREKEEKGDKQQLSVLQRGKGGVEQKSSKKIVTGKGVK